MRGLRANTSAIHPPPALPALGGYSLRLWLERLVIVVILLCWILPGLVGRDPWKPDEAYTLGLVKHIAESGDLVVPELAGEPFMEKPPLFFIVAAAFGKWFNNGRLAFHDAARLATALFLLIALAAQAGLARTVGRSGTTGALVLLGCLGLLVHAHQLITDIALLAGCACGLLGLVRCTHSTAGGSVLLGLGAGIAFLSKGLLGPGLLAVTALLVPVFDIKARRASYASSLLLALAVASPMLLIWPVALWQRAPDLFQEWLWVHNLGRFVGTTDLGPHPPHGGYWAILPWFTLPAWPFALLALWRDRADQSGDPVPLLYLMVGVVVLGMAADARELYALPLLPGLSALAVRAELPVMPRWLSSLSWIIGGVLLALLWLGWLEAADTVSPRLSVPWHLSPHPFGHLSPFLRFISVRPDQAHPSAASAWLALAVTTIWASHARLQIAANMAGWWRNWAAMLAAVWAVFILLYLPWLSVGNGYGNLAHAIADQTRRIQPSCVASYHLGEPQRALLDYYESWRSERWELGKGFECPLLLVQHSPNVPLPDLSASWELLWHGARPGMRNEWFELYRRRSAQSPSTIFLPGSQAGVEASGRRGTVK